VLVGPESLHAHAAGSRPGDSFATLQLQVHNDLRAQYPEWIQRNGDCPICDFYEARLAQLLEGYALNGSDESAAAVHRGLQEAASVDHLPGA